MKFYVLYVAVFIFSLLIGCSPSENSSKDTQNEKAHMNALDKARQVEQVLQDSAEQRRKEIEQEGG